MHHLIRFVLLISLSTGTAQAVAPTGSDPGGELLYNGIRLPRNWPPAGLDSTSRAVPVVPYLAQRPEVVPIDVGRQLFVDDFLIGETTLRRSFHQPVKYAGNPVLKPEAPSELNQGVNPTAVPFSDGVFYDPADRLFKMWYMAGWYDGTALAVSEDGLHWRRPVFDVVPGTNLVAPRDQSRRDGVSVWLDHAATDPQERFKMFRYTRTGEVGGPLQNGEGNLLTSADGIRWNWRGKTGATRDNTTFFYNPFRKVWVFSHRTRSANAAQWRDRGYWENPAFLAALDGWDGYELVFWVGPDKLDPPHPAIGDETQLYKVDAVAYESLMLGLIAIHSGPHNEVAAGKGVPKLTELQVAFSRDGFHWDRSARETFIGATLKAGSWERGYISSAGGVCLIVGDKLHFYYGAFQGDESKAALLDEFKAGDPLRKAREIWSGMYANGATGLAILRRDGFASMDAGETGGVLTTRPVTFTGKHLFVNVDCPPGALRVEVLDVEGRVIMPFEVAACLAVGGDSTLQAVQWTGGADLSVLARRPVRFRFHLSAGSLYAFWVSPDSSGASHGFVAAGGPGFIGETDTVGRGGKSR